MNQRVKSDQIRLSLDAFSRLVITLPDGEEVIDVYPVRCFPFSAPQEHIAICDNNGREVFHVAHIDGLQPAARTLLISELARREFVPKIDRIISILPESEPSEWHVETDRGEVRFVLQNEDGVRRLDLHGVLITDKHTVRYHVPEIRSLDSRSQKLLQRYL